MITKNIKKTALLLILIVVGIFVISCNKKEKKKKEEAIVSKNMENMLQINDKRISLKLNSMQKNHQLKNMRSHLEAIQNIIGLLSQEKYDEASKIAYLKLGSTTEMKLMCASFGNKQFENLGLNFHKSADKMSEIFKNKDKNKSLEALSSTMSYCVKCHSAFKQ